MGQDIPDNIPNTKLYPCWYPPYTDTDYFNLLAFNEKGQALIIEDLTANSAWGSWHLVNGVLEKGENPISAAQQKLLAFTGFQSDNWLYMGSFMLNNNKPDVNGHFFAAMGVKSTMNPHYFDSQICCIKWVSHKDLKYALIDGRIGIMSYAVTASLALLLSPQSPLIPMIK
ncbi:MAG: NUDIX domain-containing protein [Ardenticatenaceae bacterium]|nr:NUDIX domain-containing protein [Ardenticatenaceae bacterium]